jgi:hypothetical protein
MRKLLSLPCDFVSPVLVLSVVSQKELLREVSLFAAARADKESEIKEKQVVTT